MSGMNDLIRGVVEARRQRALSTVFGDRLEARERGDVRVSIDAGAGTPEDRGEPPNMDAFVRGSARAVKERRAQLIAEEAAAERYRDG